MVIYNSQLFPGGVASHTEVLAPPETGTFYVFLVTVACCGALYFLCWLCTGVCVCVSRWLHVVGGLLGVIPNSVPMKLTLSYGGYFLSIELVYFCLLETQRVRRFLFIGWF